MRYAAILLGAATLAACGQEPETNDVGKYQILTSYQPAGTIRLNTETGQAELLVASDGPVSGSNVAVLNGQQRVWARIRGPNEY